MNEKFKKLVAAAELTAMLCTTVGCASSGVADAAEGKPVSTSTAETIEESIEDTEVRKNLTAEDVLDWIQLKASKNENVSLEEAEQWYQEDLKQEISDILLPWGRELVAKEIKKQPETRDYMAVRDQLLGPERIYYAVYGEEILSPCIRILQDMYVATRDSRQIEDRYPIGLSEYNCGGGDYYVERRLDPEYSGQIRGSLQQEAGIKPTEHDSDWVVYDTYRGDDGRIYTNERPYILHCDQANPFTQQGVYTFGTLDTAQSLKIQDENGFQNEIPIKIPVYNLGQFQIDQERCGELDREITKNAILLSWFAMLETNYSVEYEKQEVLDITGMYKDFTGEWNHQIALIEEFSSMEDVVKAPFYSHVANYVGNGNVPPSPIYKLGKNVYFMGSCEVIGFYKYDGKITMDISMFGPGGGRVTYTK